MSRLQILISIDDTDNLESSGSGTLAENLSQALQKKGLAECSEITRHQLFVHEDIPYTSGNSAMCFSAYSYPEALDKIIEFNEDFLRNEAAEGSDPGLCVALNDGRLDKDILINFGLSAKHTIKNKQSAYDLARTVGVHLSEHGGTGGGVIGALAAIGLRLHGNDGRFRGWHRLGSVGQTMTAKELCSHSFVDAVIATTGEQLYGDTPIVFAEDMIKTVLLHGVQAVPVEPNIQNSRMLPWMTLSKKSVKQF